MTTRGRAENAGRKGDTLAGQDLSRQAKLDMKTRPSNPAAVIVAQSAKRTFMQALMNLKNDNSFPETSRQVSVGPPLVCIVGYSGSGKTTLMVRLIDSLVRRGYRVGTIKHDSQGGRMDHPGKDSYRHKAAGAAASIISSPQQIAMVADVAHEQTPEDLVPLLAGMDIVLAEGYKRARLPKIEVYRPETGKDAACQGDPHLLAVVSDASIDWGVPCFASADVASLADLVIRQFSLQTSNVVSLKPSR